MPFRTPFFYFLLKKVTKGGPKFHPLFRRRLPETLPERSWHATSIFYRKWSPKGSRAEVVFAAFWCPGPPKKRICDAPLTFNDFYIDWMTLFPICCRKWSPKSLKCSPPEGLFSAKMHRYRFQKASATLPWIFNWICIDFGALVSKVSMILSIIVYEFWVGSPFSPFPKHLTTKPDSPVSPWGAAVNALRLQYRFGI